MSDQVTGETIAERIEDVDEISSGHELYKDDVSLTVTFDHLSEPQAIALMAMFEEWERHGSFGVSRWMGFFVDGDGPFHPKIDIEPSTDIIESEELKEAAEINNNEFDFGAVTGQFIDYALEVDDNE